MRISQKIILTAVTVITIVALSDVFKIRNSLELEKVFTSIVESETPSLTSLIEIKSSARQASLKAVEYSIRGAEKDKNKSLEAIEKVKYHLFSYTHLESKDDRTPHGDIQKLKTLSNNFIQTTLKYLHISEGPSLSQLTLDESELHKARKILIHSIKRVKKVETQLLLEKIKGEARKTSLKSIEYYLRGIPKDHAKALESIAELKKLSSKLGDKGATVEVNSLVLSYVKAAKNYLADISKRKSPVSEIYLNEEQLNKSRKALIHTLYKLISTEESELDKAGTEAKNAIGNLINITIMLALLLTVIIISLHFFIYRSISKPITDLIIATKDIGAGKLETKINISSNDEIRELADSFNVMTEKLKLSQTERELQEEKLRRSQKMDALGKLTGGIAHDYNNMLGVILGYAEILEEQLKERPELSDFISEIYRAGERGAKLTKKLLSFSRQSSSDAKPLDINAVLKGQHQMLEKTLTSRISLTMELADNLWKVWIDDNEFEDSIINMSINAMHAIEGNGKLKIETRNEVISETEKNLYQLEAGEYVLLSITDTGSGMDASMKEKIFDPFFSTKGDKGTGLGLSQVYGFVERSRGSIQVYSEIGHGSRFTLYFPRYFDGESEQYEEEIDEQIDLSGTETILIVDDEPALVKLSSRILKQNGYHIFTAENAKQALDILEKESIDLLLSDIIMPDMDGYQLAAAVIEKYPEVKIQLASGFSDERHLDMADNSLHEHLLHKPYHSKTLLKRIRELLE